MNEDFNQSINGTQHKLLRFGLWCLTAITIPASIIPFIRTWLPSSATKLQEAPARVDISELAPGQMLTAVWQGKPVWVIRRTPQMIKALERTSSNLKDPQSNASVQPESTQNSYRSLDKEYFVVLGKCTHLGCIPILKSSEGILCPCHGSKFDFAGRVVQGSPATKNLMVPPYHFSQDRRAIIIG
jgi:ubiquinol-cytochrome c reductase iron-sulfur subunit